MCIDLELARFESCLAVAFDRMFQNVYTHGGPCHLLDEICEHDMFRFASRHEIEFSSSCSRETVVTVEVSEWLSSRFPMSRPHVVCGRTLRVVLRSLRISYVLRHYSDGLLVSASWLSSRCVHRRS